ncbi:DUF1190 domain-containing protein [Rhizobium sp. GR12]|uniref:DUF1190 domain-containing protein n=1 Tax=Rhizobium sp. GR12 TaxID=3053925 RepID=UPI002FBDFB45
MPKRWIGNHPYLSIGTIAATGLALTTCSPNEDTLYFSADKCISSKINPEVCRVAAEDARQSHLATAPRYRNMVACEMEYGARNCSVQKETPLVNNSIGNSIFTPTPVGFILPAGIQSIEDYDKYRRRQEGRRDSDSGSAISVYKKRNGDLVTPDPSAKNSGQADFTNVKPLNSKTNVTGRSGFGSGFFSGG